MKMSDTGIYYIDGDVITESGDVKVYQDDYDTYLEIGPAHTLWALGSERKDYEKQLSNRPFGDILEVGLGLGVSAKYMLSLEKVKSLITVELNSEVIKVFNYLNIGLDKRHTIINSNGLDYVKSIDKKFDFIFLDYYTLLDEETLAGIEIMVYWCKKILKPGGKIIGWYDKYTPDNFTIWFNEIFGCNMKSE
jgi:hypothetical protein